MGSFLSLGHLVRMLKKAEEYGIMFKLHILKLVILIPAAAALPGFHMAWLKNRRRE